MKMVKSALVLSKPAWRFVVVPSFLVSCIVTPSYAEPFTASTVLTINAWETTCWHSTESNVLCRISKRFATGGRVQIDFRHNQVDVALSQCKETNTPWEKIVINRKSESEVLKSVSKIFSMWVARCQSKGLEIEDIEDISWVMLRSTR